MSLETLMTECTYVYVQSDLKNICVRKKKSFVYESHLKPLHQPQFFGSLIDNRADAPIFVLDQYDGET